MRISTLPELALQQRLFPSDDSSFGDTPNKVGDLREKQGKYEEAMNHCKDARVFHIQIFHYRSHIRSSNQVA